MPADDAFEPDPPDADTVYAHYLDTCRRLGVEPVPRERAGRSDAEVMRADELIAEWTATIESATHSSN